MMAEEPLRQSLASAAKSLYDSQLLNIAGDQLRVIKRFEPDLEALSKLSGKTHLQRLRRIGRVLVAGKHLIRVLVARQHRLSIAESVCAGQ